MTTQISGTTGLSRNALPFLVGQVIFTAGGVAPAGFLKCDGAVASRSTYAALFAVCGTTFGVGNGSTTFNLPDLRGEFVRGWDDGRGVDSGRALGGRSHGLFRTSPAARILTLSDLTMRLPTARLPLNQWFLG